MVNDHYAIVDLKNGAKSIHAEGVKETFHPVIGPALEARALYVHQLRLRERMEGEETFVVWDVGLGGAGNVLTVLEETRGAGKNLRIFSFDHTLAPLRFALQHAESLGYFGDYAPWVERVLRDGRGSFLESGRRVDWEVFVGDFPSWLHSADAESIPKPHAILFDAYSPAKNPTMWTLPLFARLFSILDPKRPCSMPTYSRSTILRVTWLLAGFYVGVGEATGEKDQTTLAANCLEFISNPLGEEWLKRAARSTSAEPLEGGHYVQRPLSKSTWEMLRKHPQFQELPASFDFSFKGLV